MNSKEQGTIIARVIGASVDVERHEYPAANGDYFRLSNFANTTNTAGRIEIAAACYLYGGRELRSSRAFDNCFENGDADAVVAELTRRADADPKLHAAICADFSGSFPASWRAAADQAPAQLELI